MATEPWLERLNQGEGEAAWDRFIDRYHRLIFATVRHYAEGYDEVMDLFAHVCELLRANDLGRLRKFAEIPQVRVRFSTWLVAVVRNLVIDWFRKRDGRKRLQKVVADLPPVQRDAIELVVLEENSPAEAYELFRSKSGGDLSFGDFLRALAEAQRSISQKRPGRLLAELAPGTRRSLTPVDHEHTVANPESLLLERETRDRLGEALARLDDGDRAAVQLYVIEGLPAAEVARLLGWKDAKMVYNHVYRSLSALRDFLSERSEPVDPA